MERSADWWKQAWADLKHGENSVRAGDWEWACFAAQQAAERGVKAVLERQGERTWGHSVFFLLQAVGEFCNVPAEVVHAAKMLDKHYIPARYPNGFVRGAPVDYYTREEAEHALRCAEEVLRFCERIFTEP